MDVSSLLCLNWTAAYTASFTLNVIFGSCCRIEASQREAILHWMQSDFRHLKSWFYSGRLLALISYDPILPLVSTAAHDLLVPMNARVMTITVSIVNSSSSHGESYIADNDEHALFYVACHSNDVFLIRPLWQPGIVQCVTTVCEFQCCCYFLFIVMTASLNARVIAISLCCAYMLD